ncbi:hypothetical protein [Paenarthrobacter sp. YIM B13468]|uniref:hypothetical protein n=1 Tax=Paenarthrobacter sp. YIM B13468 TaxID=3366295 RepID=UPI0036717E0B
MGLLNFLNRRSLPTVVAPPSAVGQDASTGQEPKPAAEPVPGQLADLEAARTELLQLAAAVGVESLNACPRDGSRWQDDPATIRAITAVIREAHLEEQLSAEDGWSAR